MIFDNFGRHFGAPRVTFRDSVLKWGSQGPPEQNKNKKGDPFLVRPGSQEGHFLVQFGAIFSKWFFFKRFLVTFFGLLKSSENGAPQGGVDMQSAHVGACFVRVGRCRFGSILGSILESFWGPSSPLYSFLVARVAKTGSQKRG